MNEPTLALPFFNPSGAYTSGPTSPFSETFESTYTNGSGSSSYQIGQGGGTSRPQVNGHRSESSIARDTRLTLNPAGNMQNLALPQGHSAQTPESVTNQANGFTEPDYSTFYDPSAYLQTSPAPPNQPLPQAGPSRSMSQSTSPTGMENFVSHHTSPVLNWDGRQGNALGTGYGGIKAEQLYLPPQGAEEADEELVGVDEAEGLQEVDGEEGAQEGVDGEMEDIEEPLYVNAKQYHRILKRRAARQRLEELNRLARSRKVGWGLALLIPLPPCPTS